MIRINIENTAQLVEKLEELKYADYIFRGHEDARYELVANAFRPDKIGSKLAQEYLISPAIYAEWLNSPKVIECIGLTAPQVDTNRISFFIRRLGNYILFIMQYNYRLHKHFEANLYQIANNDKETIDIRNSVEFWTSFETFLYFFDAYFRASLKYTDFSTGAVIRDSYLFEELAGVDETLPQHYDCPTAALDWTYNYWIAIYFGLGERQDDLSIAANIPSSYFSIYAFKNKAQNSPIEIKDKSSLVHNPRAVRQEGTFTYLKSPCTYYLKNGYFPSIEDYLSSDKFVLIKLNILRTDKIEQSLRDSLKKMGITKRYLFPEYDKINLE